jgi:hypothetical protein
VTPFLCVVELDFMLPNRLWILSSPKYILKDYHEDTSAVSQFMPHASLYGTDLKSKCSPCIRMVVLVQGGVSTGTVLKLDRNEVPWSVLSIMLHTGLK